LYQFGPIPLLARVAGSLDPMITPPLRLCPDRPPQSPSGRRIRLLGRYASAAASTVGSEATLFQASSTRQIKLAVTTLFRAQWRPVISINALEVTLVHLLGSGLGGKPTSKPQDTSATGSQGKIIPREPRNTPSYCGNPLGATLVCHPSPLKACRNTSRSLFSCSVKLSFTISLSRNGFGSPPLS